jgi:hypothetical protein
MLQLQVPRSNCATLLAEHSGEAGWTVRSRNFMERMHTALSSAARVIALFSNEYLAS